MPGDWKPDRSRAGDSSDFMGEDESVWRGLSVPASLGALDPPDPPPLMTELLLVEERGRSGDWAGPGAEGGLAVSAASAVSWMLGGSEDRHLLVRLSRLGSWCGRGVGNKPERRENPC